MSAWPAQDEQQQARARARAAALHFRLPFRRQAWSGSVGNWMGAGLGSSIDFQDHRPYLPGDDPRYIDWQAYGRSGQYVMKLYREEVSPRLDLIFDLSASMRLTRAKAARSLELFLFCLESALRGGATLRTYALGSDEPPPIFQSLELPVPVFPAIGKIPLRPHSLRVLISDLLFPGDPETWLRPLRGIRSHALVFAPSVAEESDPDWDGNVEFVDCESAAARVQRVDDAVRLRYAASYQRHFEIWQESARRLGSLFVRIPAEVPLLEALRSLAWPGGMVETWT